MAPKGSPRPTLGAGDRLWKFAGREFDESRLELRVGGKAVELELKPLELLVQLLRRASEVVTKDELLETVWPGLTVVDSSIATAIFKLRKALEDEDSTIIVTVPRIGYRLEAPVRNKAIPSAEFRAQIGLESGNLVPGREQWRLLRPLNATANSEVWLASHAKTHEPRVFKFAANEERLRSLKREVTVSRYLRESLGARPDFVRILEWSLDTSTYFLESEYGGPNLEQWAEEQGGLSEVPLSTRINLLREVAEAVSAAHSAGVLHRDLKPANILVTSHGAAIPQIKVGDFGSASLLDSSILEELGITNMGLTRTMNGRNHALAGTLLYMAPEILAGHPPTVTSDVYSLGIMLYQLAIGDLRRPLSAGWEAGIDDPLLREDIAAAACGDPARRLTSVAKLAERLTSIERRRAEQKVACEIRKSQDASLRKREEQRLRRPWMAIAAVAVFVAVAVSFYFYKRNLWAHPLVKSVAVLPFQNAGFDRSLDFLRLALPDEVATSLTYARSLSIRPFASTSKYVDPNVDLRKAGGELHVNRVVTGHFLKAGQQLEITLEAINVEDERVLWRDTFSVPADNLIAMHDRLIVRTQGALAAAFGASQLTSETATRPGNEAAYNLFLRSLGVPFDAGPNKTAKEMLERAVGLDPNYAPAWVALSRRYYAEARYAGEDGSMMERFEAANEHALGLDPGNIEAASGLAVRQLERGELTRANEIAVDLVRRHPENAAAHFVLSYVLRFAGLLEQSATQCELAFSLDPHVQTNLLRTCSIPFLMQAKYDHAAEFLRLDGESNFARALSIHILVHEGKLDEATKVDAPHIPGWESFDLLLACAQNRPRAEIDKMSRNVQAVPDPETNYFSASHLAYCGEYNAALQMLRKAILGNYCAYPALDSDPFFAGLRNEPEWAEIRSAAMQCQKSFSSGQN